MSSREGGALAFAIHYDPDLFEAVVRAFLATTYFFVSLRLAKNALDAGRKKRSIALNEPGGDDSRTRLAEDEATMWALTGSFVLTIVAFFTKVRFNVPADQWVGVNLVGQALLLGTPVFLAVSFLAINAVQALRGVTTKTRRYGVELAERPDPGGSIARRLEWYRKLNHLALFFVILLTGLATGALSRQYPSEDVWGDPQMSRIAKGLSPSVPLTISQLVLVVFFYVLADVLLFVDVTRVSTGRFSHFFLHKTVQRVLRKKELDRLGSFTLFATGYLLAALVLPFSAFLASLVLFCLGDTAAAVAGRRASRGGRGHRLPKNEEKTWEGLLAGTLVSFGGAAPLVGVTWGLAAAGLFLATDLLSPSLVKVDDNLLLPLGATGAFVLLSALGVPAAPLLWPGW